MRRLAQSLNALLLASLLKRRFPSLAVAREGKPSHLALPLRRQQQNANPIQNAAAAQDGAVRGRLIPPPATAHATATAATATTSTATSTAVAATATAAAHTATPAPSPNPTVHANHR